MRLIPALLVALACATPTLAQDDPTACWDRVEGQDPVNTFFNKQMTDYWRQMLQQADGNLMAQMAGIYYGERPSPDGVYLNRQYRSYEPNGLFQYQDQTCSVGMPGAPCSQNQGTGEWRAAKQGDGTIYVMTRFTDMIRTSVCAGERIQFNGNGFADESGIFWQRTQ
jgi:hypothetical protein